MTNKEYRKRKEQIEKFNFLNPKEANELRKDVKSRTGEFQLEGFGNRASVKEDGNRIVLRTGNKVNTDPRGERKPRPTRGGELSRKGKNRKSEKEGKTK